MARVEESARRAAPRTESTNGETRTPDSRPTPDRRIAGVPRPPGIAMLVVGALLVAALGVYFLREQSLYVSTDQATIAGPMIQVASQASGQLRFVAVDVGDEVRQGQVVAAVALPTGTSGASQFTVRSPIDGIVVARQGNPGDAASSGRTILTLADPSNMWVEALVDHGQVSRLRPGQTVDVFVPSLGRTLPGFVAAVGRASAATTSQLQRRNDPSSGQAPASQAAVPPGASFVPVRIGVEYGVLPLVLGSAVSIRIHV